MPPLKWLGHQLLSSFLCRMRGSCEGDNGWGFRQLRVWGEEIISILGAGGGMQDVLVSQSEAGVMCWARLTCILLPWAGTDICFSFFSYHSSLKITCCQKQDNIELTKHQVHYLNQWVRYWNQSCVILLFFFGLQVLLIRKLHEVACHGWRRNLLRFEAKGKKKWFWLFQCRVLHWFTDVW